MGDTCRVVVRVCRAMQGKAQRRISYARIKASDIIADNFAARPQWIGVCPPPPRWLGVTRSTNANSCHSLRRPASHCRCDTHHAVLTNDRACGALGKTQFPGSVLVRLGLGRHHRVPPLDWEAQMQEAMREMFYYQLRVHVFAARNLPAADADGTADPYVQLAFRVRRCGCQCRCGSCRPAHRLRRPCAVAPTPSRRYVVVRAGGIKAKTDKRRDTLNPEWYKTLNFDLTLPRDLNLAPQVRVLLCVGGWVRGRVVAVGGTLWLHGARKRLIECAPSHRSRPPSRPDCTARS